MSVAASRLRSFRNTRRMSRKELATKLGVHASMVAQIESGTRTPGLLLAARIEELTAGFVAPRDWVSAKLGRSDAA